MNLSWIKFDLNIGSGGGGGYIWEVKWWWNGGEMSVLMTLKIYNWSLKIYKKVGASLKIYKKFFKILKNLNASQIWYGGKEKFCINLRTKPKPINTY